MIVNLELRRGLKRLTSLVDEEALSKELQAVAAIPNECISRRERERLLVRKALVLLPQNTRLIVFLKFWERESLEEIARTLRLTVEQARMEYIIALSYLEKVLRPYVLRPEFFMKENNVVG